MQARLNKACARTAKPQAFKVFDPVPVPTIKFSGHLAIHERLIAQTPNSGCIYRNSSTKLMS